MILKALSVVGIALAASFSALTAQAATIPFSETITQNFGTNTGHVAPIYGKGGTMAADYVTVLDKNDSTGNRFYNEVSFAGLVYDTISSITLTLNVADAPYKPFLEDWRVYASNNGGTNKADRTDLGKLNGSNWSVTLSSGSVLKQAVSAGKLAFWFGDEGFSANNFKLFSASVTVEGQAEDLAPVPLPAAGFLLVGALGGLAAVRRRKTTA